MTNQPVITENLSISIVACNEEAFLPNLLRDIKAQTYPHKHIEVLLIDSQSTDHSRRIMEKFKEENTDFYSVQIFENKKKIQAAGWNVAIKNFTGDVLARIDAHTKVEPDYSKYVMENMRAGENVVGGIRPCIMENDSPWANVLLQIENSLFGSSINLSRRSQEKTYVKTMFHAAYRRTVFEQVGFFHEKLLRTEDNEMHYRIRKAGYRLCYDPRIVSYQYARGCFREMIKQNYGNGYWIGATLKICPKCVSLYHLVPLAFVLAIIVTTIMIGQGIWQLSALLWSAYGLFALINTLFSGVKNRFYIYTIFMPILFLVLHMAYGIGTGVGLLSLSGGN